MSRLAAGLRLVLAVPVPLLRAGLVAVLTEAGHAVLAAAPSGAVLLAQAEQHDWEIALLDLDLPDRDSLDLLRLLARRYPARARIAIARNSARDLSLRALRAGAAACLDTRCAIDELLTALSAAAAGQIHTTPAMLQLLLSHSKPGAPHEQLSEREFQVLLALASGRSICEIGRLLFISPKTVTTYRARLLGKLGLERNAELVRYALEHGLLGDASSLAH